jgi:predicted Fe-Mo cluster-binding NifX family protein
MKIAITTSGPTLDAELDPRFGRCAYFLIVDTNTLDFEAIENANAALGGGAGIQSGQLMAGKGVKFVLTGNCGPNAHATLSAAGIGVIPGCSGVVRDAVEQFRAGQLNTASEPTVASHSGMADLPSPPQDQPMPAQQSPMSGGGMGMGRGRGGGGGGRGMGRGMGKGMGRGGGQGRGRGGGGGMGQGRGQGRGMGA